MPANDGVGPDDDQDILPPRPQPSEGDPEDTIGRPHSRSWSFGGENGELLAEREVLEQEIGSRRQERSEPTQDRGNSLEHRKRMEAGGSTVNGAPMSPIAV